MSARIGKELAAKAKRALERRFGQSVLNIEFRNATEHYKPGCIRAVDSETGSWIEGVMTGKRFRVYAEHDAA